MAPLEHADSIIEESVVSTSPYRPGDTDNDTSTTTTETSSLPLRSLRVTRTYGKPKASKDDDSDTGYNFETRAHTLRTAPPDTERMVIPESEDSSTLARHTSGFKWKQQLREIDDKFNGQSTVASSVAISAPSASSVDENHTSIQVNTSIFDGSLSPLNLSQYSLLHREETTTQATGAAKDTIDDYVDCHSFKTTSTTFSESAEGMGDSVRGGIFRAKSLDGNSSATEEDASRSIEEQGDVDKASKGKQKGRVKQRPKKTSKKELIEIQKESARLLAERPVEIRRSDQRPTRTMQDLFAKLRPKNVTSGNSDPIRTFSSPDSSALSGKSGNSAQTKVISPVAVRHSTPPKKQRDGDSDSEQSSDVELPTAESILESENAKRSAKSTEGLRMKELKERKLLALTSKLTSSTSSDDDLEVEELITPRRLSKMSGENAAKRHIGLWYKRNNQDKQTSNINLELAAKPLFGADTLTTTKSNRSSAMSHESLNQILLQRAETQSIELEDKKKQQWVQQGGSLKPAKPSGSSIESWLQRGLEKIDKNDQSEVHGRSVEPETNPEDEDDTHYEGMDEVAEGNENVYDDDFSGEEDEDKENQRPLPRKVRPRVVVDSDEENDIKFAKLAILAPDSSYVDNSDSPDYHEDENKENMIDDYDTNDENVFFPAFESSTVRSMSRMHFDENLRRASPPARSGNHSRVLQVLHEEDKENTLTSVHSSPSDPAVDHSFTSSTELFEGSTLVSPANFSQLFTDKENLLTGEDPSPSPLLQRGFSQLFSLSATTAKQKPLVEEIKIGGLPSNVDDNEFEFTQPNTLLPSVQISESQRREVDNMFNKDQEYKLDEAKQARLDAQRSGLNRSKTPYFGSFIASPQAEISPIIRQPLATMSLTPMDDSEETTMVYEDSPQVKLTRLRKERPQDRAASISPGALGVRNAFTILKDASINKPKKRVAKTIRSEFIEGEAQESDDEFYVGFGGMNKKQDDDDEEDEDQDAIVEGLVDDAALDDKTLAAAAVLEKHKEFEAHDDAALLKLHQDAIEGKLRVKRKNMGLGFDDSDSEDEDEYRPRKHYPKKRRIEGDTLEAWAQNPETRAFFDAYQQPLLEDENRLEINLAEQTSDNDNQESMSEEEGEGGGEDIVNASTLRKELRERVMQDDEIETTRPNLEDVTWVDVDELQSSDDVEVQVEQGVLQGKPNSQSAGSNALRFNSNFMINNASSQEKLRLKAWANQESQTRGAGGRGGFSRKGEKDQSGSSRNSSHKHATNDNRVKGSDGTSVDLKSQMTSSLIASVQKQKRFED